MVTSETKAESGNLIESQAGNKKVSVNGSNSMNSARSEAGAKSNSDPSRSAGVSSTLHSQGGKSSTHALYKWWKKRQTGTNQLLQEKQ